MLIRSGVRRRRWQEFCRCCCWRLVFPNELLKPYQVYGVTPNSTDFRLLVEISR